MTELVTFHCILKSGVAISFDVEPVEDQTCEEAARGIFTEFNTLKTWAGIDGGTLKPYYLDAREVAFMRAEY